MSLRNLKLIAIGIVSILVLVIIFRNLESVQTDLLFFTIELPRAVLLFLTTLIGFIIGLFTAYFLIKGGDEGEETIS